MGALVPSADFDPRQATSCDELSMHFLFLRASMSCFLLFLNFLVALPHYSQQQHHPTSSLLLSVQKSLPVLFTLEVRQMLRLPPSPD